MFNQNRVRQKVWILINIGSQKPNTVIVTQDLGTVSGVTPQQTEN